MKSQCVTLRQKFRRSLEQHEAHPPPDTGQLQRKMNRASNHILDHANKHGTVITLMTAHLTMHHVNATYLEAWHLSLRAVAGADFNRGVHRQFSSQKGGANHFLGTICIEQNLLQNKGSGPPGRPPPPPPPRVGERTVCNYAAQIERKGGKNRPFPRID